MTSLQMVAAAFTQAPRGFDRPTSLMKKIILIIIVYMVLLYAGFLFTGYINDQLSKECDNGVEYVRHYSARGIYPVIRCK
jgi:hypothetical protein